MTSLWQAGLTVTLDPGGSPTSLNDDLMSLPRYTDTVTEEPRQGLLVLEALNGKYITTAPIITEFNKIRIAHTAEDGSIYNHVFEVIKIIPRQSKREGTKLELQLRGIESNVQDIQYVKPHFNEHAKNVSVDILDYYMVEKGTDQPSITDYEGTDNDLPTFVLNNYEYGLNEDSCWNRMQETVDKLAASPDAGGVFDFFEFRFDSDASDENLLHFKAFVSGSTPPSPLTIQQDFDVNVGETEAGIEAKKGTVVINYGANNEGSYPTDFSRFRGEEEAFSLHPPYDAAASYSIGHKVNKEGIHYSSLTNNNVGNDPVSTDPDWLIITERSEFGDVITYSPWTRQKSGPIKNSGANHGDLGTDTSEPYGESFWDGNLIVWDDSSESAAFQSWVNVRAITSAGINTNYLYGGVTAGQARTLRVLVDPVLGSVGVPWTQNSGKDKNGKEFRNAIVQHNGGNETGATEWQNWNVLYEANTTNHTGFACAVKDEGRVYVYDFDFSPTDRWVNEAGIEFGNHCFHPYDSVTDDGGVFATDGGDTPFTANTQSAIKVIYSHLGISPIPILNETKNKNYHSAGAWINMSWPFPETTFRGIGEKVGEIYGGGDPTVHSPPEDGPKEPTTIDSQNMHFTHNGLRGFNHGLDSADYGPLSTIDFILRHNISHSLLGTLLRGDLKWRVFFFDTGDNVVFQDFTLPHNGVWEAVSLPLGGFQTYRGRKPFESVLSSIIPPKQLSPVNAFLWRNTKLMCLQWQEPYDDDGRYKPWITNENLIAVSPLGGTITHTVHLDSLRFSKPLLAVTDAVSDRVIQQQGLENPTTINYKQLFNDAKAELEKQKFQRRQYDVVTSGRYDIKPGESFFVLNPDTVPTSDDSGTLNTIKLVAKKIEYSITKPKGGTGGFLRTITGVRRLET